MIVEIDDISKEELRPYASLTEAQLRGLEDGGLLIAESPKVINTALASGLIPASLLCERKHIEGDAREIIARHPALPVYTGERAVLASLTGYTLTRGVLCAMKRPRLPEPEKILKDARRVCVLYDICDTTNIGAIFRTSAALGIDALLLSPETCDPFNRRAIRVSMGTVFQIPWCYATDPIATLKKQGFETLSMALRRESVFLQDFAPKPEGKYAVILGSEGYGLPSRIIDQTDHTVKIPMHYGVDSLNVGAAAAITIWHFTQGRQEAK